MISPVGDAESAEQGRPSRSHDRIAPVESDDSEVRAAEANSLAAWGVLVVASTDGAVEEIGDHLLGSVTNASAFE